MVLSRFLPWIKELPCEEVYMVAGNHDFICASEYPVMKALEYLSDFKFTYLLNDYTNYRAPDGKIIRYMGLHNVTCLGIGHLCTVRNFRRSI